MSYQIDIDVNSEQLEFIQETLNSTFSSFRKTIEKLDATLNKNAKLKDTISKNDPNYVSAKSTVAAEVPILKEFESSGSVRFLNATLNSVSNSLTGLAKRAEAAGENLNIDDSFIGNIKKLSDFFANIKDESTGNIGRQSVGKSQVTPSVEKNFNFEGDKADNLSRQLVSTINTRLKVLDTYKKELVKNPQLNNPGIKAFEQELTSLISIAKTYGQTQNHALLQTALIRSEAENAVNHLRMAVGKNIPLPDSYDNANDNLRRYLGERIASNSDTKPSAATPPPGAEKTPAAPAPSTGVDKVISDFNKLLAQVKVATTLISTDANKANQNRAAAIIKLVDTTSEKINGGESVSKLSGKFFTELRDRLGKLETYSAKEGKPIVEPLNKIRSAIAQFTAGVGEKQKDTQKEVSKKKPEPVAQKVDSADTSTDVGDSGKKLAASIRGIIIDLEAVNAPDYKGSQEEINRLVKSIIHLREVTDIPVIKQTGVESYDLISGFAQFEAYKRAQQIDKTLPDRIGAVVAGDEYVGFNDKVRKLEAENPVNTPELADSKVKKGNDSIQQLIVDIDAIDIPEAAEHVKSAIESLARDIIKYGGLLSRPVLNKTNIDSYQPVGNPLQLQAYKRALELDKTLPDRINVVTVPGNKIGSAQQQFLITNASSFTQAKGNKSTSTPKPEAKSQAVKSKPEVLDAEVIPETPKELYERVKAENEKKHQEYVKQIDKELQDLLKRNEDLRRKREENAKKFAKAAEDARKAMEDMFRAREEFNRARAEAQGRYRERTRKQEESRRSSRGYSKDTEKFVNDTGFDAKIQDLIQVATERGFYKKNTELKLPDYQPEFGVDEVQKSLNKTQLLLPPGKPTGGDEAQKSLNKTQLLLPAGKPTGGDELSIAQRQLEFGALIAELLPDVPKPPAPQKPRLLAGILEADIIDSDTQKKANGLAEGMKRAAKERQRKAEEAKKKFEEAQRAKRDSKRFINDPGTAAKLDDLLSAATERGFYGKSPVVNVPNSAESLRLLDSLKFPPVPSSYNPKVPPVPSSFNPPVPPVPSSFNPKVPPVPPVPSSFNPKVPPVPSSFNPSENLQSWFNKARASVQLLFPKDLKVNLGAYDPGKEINSLISSSSFVAKKILASFNKISLTGDELAASLAIPDFTLNRTSRRLVNGVSVEPESSSSTPPPPPPRKPPAPPATPEPPEEGSGKVKSDSQIFREARDRQAILKDSLLQGGIGNIGTRRANYDDLFSGNDPKNKGKADALVNATNRWIEKQIATFDSAKLADAKVRAKLGDRTPLENLSSTNESTQRKIELAQLQAKRGGTKEEKAEFNAAKKEESSEFTSYRRGLEAKLKAALSDTTENQAALLQAVAAEARRKRDFYSNDDNSNLFLDKKKFGKDGEAVNSLQSIENRATKKFSAVQENRVETSSFQELRAAGASIRTFLQDLQTFTTGLVQVSSAMNKEVIKLGVANNNSISKTEKDIADSTALAKKFGGSVSTYLKDLANIKIADLNQIAPSGDLTSNRFLDSEVKSLVSGLRASYNVNQLDAEAQDGASKAVAQILSKGKVQAEELRGQLGDRLNGAVTLFAQALGISTAQLDRRLKEGSILDVELFKFGRLLNNKYSEAAQSPTLIKETTGLSGSVKDILTQATQPIAGVATVGAQFVNTLTDGVKANAATISVAALPIGLALVSGISGSVKDAFVKSSFTSPIITGLGEALRSNAKILGVIGGGVAAATAGSLILGTDGLDKTLLKLGDQIKALSGIIGNLFSGAGQGIKDTKIGQSGIAKFAFEALPLAAIAAPITNFAIDKSREIAENIREKNKAIPVAPGSKPSFGAQALSAVSALPFLNVAAAIGAGVLAYSVANTRFISEYADVTDKLVKELRKSNKDGDSDEQKTQNFRKNEGTDNPLSIDSIITNATDTLNVLRGNFKEVSLARLQEARKGTKDGSKSAAEIDAAIKEKIDKGYVPGSTFAGNAATTQIAKEEAAKKTLINQVKERLNPSYYQEDINKATPIVALYRAESKRLLEMQNDGVTGRPSIDAQNVRVQTLAVQAREAMPDLINAQQDVTSRIAKLEELKQGILAQDLVGAKDRAASIDAELSQLKAALPQFIQFVQSFSDPNQRISDRKIEISSREKKISLEKLNESANTASERNTSVATRNSERNDDQLNLREAGFGVKTAEQGVSKLQELLTLAAEKKDLISQQTSSDTQQAEYEAALKAEADALNALNEGTLSLTKARLDEAKAMEEFLLVRYSRSVRQFSSQDANTNAFGVKSGVLKGDLKSTIEFGTVTKAQFALNEYLKILPQLNLNADDVKEKLKELSDQLALSTLAFIEQQTSLSNAKTIAKLDSVAPTSPFRDTFFDRFDTLKRGYQKAQVEQDTTTYLTQETKKAFDNTQDPTERGNLAIKLIGLETDAIKRKHEVEMAGIELARSSYRRNMEVLATLLTRQSDTAQSSSANRSFVEGRKLEDRVAQTNEFGAALTENRQSLERLNTVLTIQSQNRGVNNTAKIESEKLFSDQFPEIPDQYKRDLSKRLTDSTQFQVNDDIKNLQSGIELAVNSQDPNAPVVSKNLGTIDVKVAEALVKLLTAIAQLKQIDQSDSVAVAQARNAFNLSTGAVVRGRRQQESNNRLSSLETKAAGEDNVGQLKVAETNAQNTINSLQAKLRGTSLTLASVFTPAEVDYNEQIRKATAGIKQAEAARAALKKTQDETANGATQVELSANAAILKGEDEKIKRLRVQLRSTQIAGADKLGTAIAAFNLDLGNLIETISSKLRESIDLLNQTASVFRAQGLDNLREPAIYDVIPQSYTDKNGVVKVRDSQSKVNYDPSISGNYETAQLLTQINKIDAEAKTKIDLLAYAQKNIAQIRNEGGVENTQQYKDVPQLRDKLKDIESLILKAKDLDEATANIDLAMGNLVASIFTDAEKAAVINAKLKRDRNNDIIAQADLTSTLSQNAERRLNSAPGNSDVLRLLKGKEPLVDDLQAQRRKAKAEYEISQLSPLQTEREKGKLLYEDKTVDITDQLSKLPAYGNRFALAIEDAVANGSRLSSVLSDAIQKGDWSNVLTDTLANIANALGDKFLNDASKGLGGLLGGGIQALFGISSNSSGTMPSYSMGMLPSYAGGNLPGGVLGKAGSAYPRTRSQDAREPNTSHLAIINSAELVVPSSEVSEYVDFKRGMTASSNINTSNTSNDSSSATYNSFNYSNYQSGKNDTFARPEVYRKQEEDSRMRRFS